MLLSCRYFSAKQISCMIWAASLSVKGPSVRSWMRWKSSPPSMLRIKTNLIRLSSDYFRTTHHSITTIKHLVPLYVFSNISTIHTMWRHLLTLQCNSTSLLAFGLSCNTCGEKQYVRDWVFFHNFYRAITLTRDSSEFISYSLLAHILIQ